MGVEVWVSLGEEGGWNPHFFGCRGVGLEVDLVGSFIEEILGKMGFLILKIGCIGKRIRMGTSPLSLFLFWM